MNAMNRGLAMPSMEVYTVTNKTLLIIISISELFSLWCDKQNTSSSPKRKTRSRKILTNCRISFEARPYKLICIIRILKL
jgi:hypothetical protein